jgi:ribonuclease P protein component
MKATKEQMSRLDRLKKRSDFLAVQKNGKKWVAKGFIIQAAPNGLEKSRFGLVVTKKLNKSAVVRNRMKRRLRAVAYDVLPLHGADGQDYVLIGRTDTLDRPYDALKRDLTWCLGKLELTRSTV